MAPAWEAQPQQPVAPPEPPAWQPPQPQTWQQQVPQARQQQPVRELAPPAPPGAWEPAVGAEPVAVPPPAAVAKPRGRRLDLAAGIALGIALGLAVIAAFLAFGSESTIDAPSVGGHGKPPPARHAPPRE